MEDIRLVDGPQFPSIENYPHLLMPTSSGFVEIDKLHLSVFERIPI